MTIPIDIFAALNGAESSGQSSGNKAGQGDTGLFDELLGAAQTPHPQTGGTQTATQPLDPNAATSAGIQTALATPGISTALGTPGIATALGTPGIATALATPGVSTAFPAASNPTTAALSAPGTPAGIQGVQYPTPGAGPAAAEDWRFSDGPRPGDQTTNPATSAPKPDLASDSAAPGAGQATAAPAAGQAIQAAGTGPVVQAGTALPLPAAALALPPAPVFDGPVRGVPTGPTPILSARVSFEHLPPNAPNATPLAAQLLATEVSGAAVPAPQGGNRSGTPVIGAKNSGGTRGNPASNASAGATLTPTNGTNQPASIAIDRVTANLARHPATPGPSLPSTAQASAPLALFGIEAPAGQPLFIDGPIDPGAPASPGAGANVSVATSGPGASRAAGTPAQPNASFSDQLAVQIISAARAGIDRITIDLKPAHLGRVEVELTIAADGRVQAMVTVDRSETLDLLQRDAKGLEKALQDAGLETDPGSLSFSLRGDGDEDGTDDGSSSWTARPDGDDSEADGDIPAAIVALAPAGMPGHNLDIRV